MSTSIELHGLLNDSDFRGQMIMSSTLVTLSDEKLDIEKE